MEGSYLQAGDLGRLAPQVAPYPCYAHGKLHPSGYHDLNPVTWWLLEHHALTLVGPEPQDLGLAIGWDEITHYMLANLRTYWRAWTRRPVRLAALLTDGGVEWAVLGISRLWYGLSEREMASKMRAGEYVLAHAPRRWHAILAEALAIRRGGTSRYRSRLARARDALGFLKHVISRSDAQPTLR